jgi:hypothetical protein
MEVSPRSPRVEPRAEEAIERYVVRAEIYVAALTRKANREAEAFVESGTPASELLTLWDVKDDQTNDALRTYRRRLAQMAHRGLYPGPTTLKRFRPDGSLEPIHLPEDGR